MAFHRLAREESLGRFRLLARLGQGGMADVFLARTSDREGADRLVAIKRMLPIISSDRALVAMFLAEGRIAARLDHPNVCRVHELDEADDTLFLVMEYLRGLPWSEIMPAIPDRPRASLVRFVVGVIAQACEGLHHAHRALAADGKPRPIVHRDISPSNLFVTDEGVVKLLDFGVSKVLTEATATVSGLLKGKLPYVAPEQASGERIDPRADIFSLAVVTWEALAGRTLFDRGSDYETLLAVAETHIPALPADDPAIEQLDAVLRRALARDRRHRHGSALELADDLRRAITAHGAPMSSSEIRAHLETWLGTSLARRRRELADLVGNTPRPDDRTGELTSIHRPAPVARMRLREVSVVVGDPRPPHAVDIPDLAGTAPSGERTRRRAPATEATLPGRPAWLSTVVLARSRRWRPGLVRAVAIAAIVTAVIVVYLLR